MGAPPPQQKEEKKSFSLEILSLICGISCRLFDSLCAPSDSSGTGTVLTGCALLLSPLCRRRADSLVAYRAKLSFSLSCSLWGGIFNLQNSLKKQQKTSCTRAAGVLLKRSSSCASVALICLKWAATAGQFSPPGRVLINTRQKKVIDANIIY